MTTFMIYGIRLFGIARGSSPIKPLSCAHMGLKYLRLIPRNLLFSVSFFMISSVRYFVLAYGFVVIPAVSDSQSPWRNGVSIVYTVAELEKIIFRTSYSSISSNSLMLQMISLS